MAVNNLGLNIEIRADNRASGPLKDAAAAIKEVSAAQREAATSAQRWQTLGARSTADIRAEMERVKAALAGIRAANSPLDDLARASQAAGQRLAALRGELAGTAQAGSGLAGVMGKFTGTLAALGASFAIRDIIQAAESFSVLKVKLEQSEGSIQAAGKALEELSRIAQSNGVPIVELGQSYERFSRSIAAMGGSQQEALSFTEALSGALKLSGATAQEAASVMLQLSQAFQKGKLNGDEFTSVSESGGRVLQFLADELYRSRGELLEMAKAGELTSREMLKLGNANQKIAEEAAKMPGTLGAAWTNFNSKLTETLGNSQAFQAVMSALGSVTMAVANNVGALLAALGGLSVTWGLAKVAAMGGLAGIAASMGGVITAVTAATASVAALKAGLVALLATPWGLFLGTLAGVIGILAIDWVAGWAAADAAQSNALDNLKQKLGEAERKLAELDDKIGASKDKLSSLFTEMGKQYDDVAKLLSEQTAGELDAIRERYAREGALLQALVTDKEQLRREETRLTIDAAEAEYQYLAALKDKRLALIAQEYNHKMQLAKAISVTADKRNQLEQEAQQKLVASLKQLWSEEATAYGQHLKDMEGQAAASQKRINDLAAERASGVKAVQDAIRKAELDTLNDAAKAEVNRQQQVKETAALKKQIAQGDEEALKQYIALLEQQYALDKKAAGNEGIQLNANERTLEQLRLVAQLKAAQDLYLKGQEEKVQREREIGVAIAAQVESMQQLVGTAQENLQSAREAMAEGAMATIGVNSDAFKAQVDQLVQWVNERDDVKLKIGVLKADTAQLEVAANQAAASAKVTIPLETEINPSLLRGSLDQAVAQIQLTPVPITPTVPVDATQALTHDLAKREVTVPVTVDDTALKTELGNLDQLNQQREVLVQVRADTQQAIADLSAFQALVASTQSAHTIVTNAQQALAEVMSLNGVNTSSTHTIYVRKVEQNASGGPIGLATGGTPFAAFPRRQGHITGPGTETSDSIPAMLSRGEFVIRAASVRKWGLDFLHAINSGFLPALPKLALGGPVSPTIASSAGLPEVAINLSIQGGAPMRVLSSRDTVRDLTQALRNLERGR